MFSMDSLRDYISSAVVNQKSVVAWERECRESSAVKEEGFGWRLIESYCNCLWITVVVQYVNKSNHAIQIPLLLVTEPQTHEFPVLQHHAIKTHEQGELDLQTFLSSVLREASGQCPLYIRRKGSCTHWTQAGTPNSRDYLRRIVTCTHSYFTIYTCFTIFRALQLYYILLFPSCFHEWIELYSTIQCFSIGMPRQLNSTAFFPHINNSSPCAPLIAVRSCHLCPVTSLASALSTQWLLR
jgi:hypothetical protein